LVILGYAGENSYRIDFDHPFAGPATSRACAASIRHITTLAGTLHPSFDLESAEGESQ
jgi:hypothetical protein